MTWYWDVTEVGTTSQTLHVWDHTGTEVYTESRSSWSWTGDTPDIVYEQIRNNLDAGISDYNNNALADAVSDNIVKGSPPP